MKLYVLVCIWIVACLLSVGGLSCTQVYYNGVDRQPYSSASEAMAAQKQKSDTVLSQITPTQTPMGGSMLLIFPTDESLLQAQVASIRQAYRKAGGDFSGPTREGADFMVKSARIELLSMVEAVRKRGLFSRVEWRQSDDPGREHFEQDFALICPTQRDTGWLLRSRRQVGQSGISIQMGPSSLSSLQQKTIWLTRMEEAVRKPSQE